MLYGKPLGILSVTYLFCMAYLIYLLYGQVRTRTKGKLEAAIHSFCYYLPESQVTQLKVRGMLRESSYPEIYSWKVTVKLIKSWLVELH